MNAYHERRAFEEKVFMPHVRHMLTEDELWWLETMPLKGIRGIQGRLNVERPWHAVYDRLCDDVRNERY